MGRKPTRNKNLPTGMRARHRAKTWYYLDTGEKPRKEIPLGSDYVVAVQKWAQLTMAKIPTGAIVTFRHAAERYQREVIPKKGAETQKDNLRELSNLLKFFDSPPAPLDDIEPQHIRQYLDWRWKNSAETAREKNVKRIQAGKEPIKLTGREGQVRSNREKALFSHVWNFARGAGLTNRTNPCTGVQGFTESGRDIYISDEVYLLVWECAEPGLQDAMDIAYLSAQRKADVLKFSQSDIKDKELNLVQNKTGRRLRITVEGYLAQVLERINKRKVTGVALVCNKNGQRMTKYELRGAFDRAREAAAEKRPDLASDVREFQFRDLRAKAATDKEESGGMQAAQDQLGHSNPTMTAAYVRHRRGKLVKPTK